MNRRHARALFDPGLVCVGIEEGNVVGDGAGEQHIVLHHRADLGAPGVHAHSQQVRATNADAALLRQVDAHQQVDQGRLAAAGGASDGDRLSGRDVHVQALEHVG